VPSLPKAKETVAPTHDYPILGNDGNHYRELRPESKTDDGKIDIAIYERQGDDKLEYMQAANVDFVAMLYDENESWVRSGFIECPVCKFWHDPKDRECANNRKRLRRL
jgi:hypothetical protein